MSGIILIVDDDLAVRESTARLFRRTNYTTQAYDSGDAFLASRIPDSAQCILLDIRMPGTDGLGVLRALEGQDGVPPVIVMTGHGDIPLAVEAMRLGAADFLEKPYSPDRLFQAIERAVGPRRERRKAPARDAQACAALDRLSWRQRQVLAGILCGHPNKVIAFELGLSVRTVEAYRAQLLVKLKLRGTAEVVKFALAAGIDGSDFGKGTDPGDEDPDLVEALPD